jgi:5'-nucleotidase
VNLFDASGAVVWIDNVSPDSRSYSFTHLPTSTSYTATLTAINAVGSSAPSAGFAVATNPLDPMAPLLQTVENGGNSGMSLTVSGDTAVAHINSDSVGARTEGGVRSVWVYGIVYSTASSLGWVQIDTDGNATWTLPTLAAGVHHLAVLNDAGGIIATASGTGNTGGTDQTTGLAFTGTDPGSPLTLAVFALVSGIALVAVNRRRRMLARR